jgi:hypothetical protein
VSMSGGGQGGGQEGGQERGRSQAQRPGACPGEPEKHTRKGSASLRWSKGLRAYGSMVRGLRRQVETPWGGVRNMVNLNGQGAVEVSQRR